MILWTLFRNSLPLQLVVLALAAWGTVGANNLYQRNVGASRLANKIEKANDNATKLGGGAAAGSLDVRVRGKRDPSTRDD